MELLSKVGDYYVCVELTNYWVSEKGAALLVVSMLFPVERTKVLILTIRRLL